MTDKVADELTLADYALILWRRRKLVAACTLAGALLALAAHFVLPRKYEATALILPPQEEGTESLAAKLAGLSDSLPLGMPGIKAPAERYVDILKSEKVAAAIADRFGRNLGQRPVFEVTKGSLISIIVTDRKPETAAKRANAYAEVLGQIVSELVVGKAGRDCCFGEDVAGCDHERRLGVGFCGVNGAADRMGGSWVSRRAGNCLCNPRRLDNVVCSPPHQQGAKGRRTCPYLTVQAWQHSQIWKPRSGAKSLPF
jgi:hypothetical protein